MDTSTTATAPRRQDHWYWRLVATGVAFALFGLGGLVLRLLVFPLLRILPGDAAQDRWRARRAIWLTFRYFVRYLQASGILTLEIRGRERLGQPGQLLIANHPSLLDVVLLISQIENANCVVKHSLATNPYTRGPVGAAGYITNDESFDMLDRAAEVLRQGETLLIFPEGTRTPVGASPRFHRGACAIALRGARLVTPVVIRMSPRSLTKGEPWYHIPPRRMRYCIEVGEPVDPAAWREAHPLPIAGRKLNDFLQSYFEKALRKE